MTTETESLLQAARALPEAERVQLAEQILETLPVDGDECTDEELLAELERRAEEYEKDPSIGIPLSRGLSMSRRREKSDNYRRSKGLTESNL